MVGSAEDLGVAAPLDTRDEQGGESRRRRPVHHLGSVALWIWPVALIVIAWQAWVVLGHVPKVIAPRPAEVLRFVVDNRGSYWHDAWNFLTVVLSGVVLGLLGGILFAVVGWLSSMLKAAIGPMSLVTQCLPIVVMVPILGRIFGYQPRTIVVIAALIAFFPALVFTSRGLSSPPAGSEDLFTVFGASRWRRLRMLAAPASIPFVLLSVRLAVIGSVIGALVGQWILGTRGLGYRLALAQLNYHVADTWGSALITVVISIALFAIATSLCRRAAERFE